MIPNPKISAPPGMTAQIQAARVLLDTQLRQDAAYNRPVSKVRYVLPDQTVVVVTHEYDQTYIQIAPRKVAQETSRQVRVPLYFLALVFVADASYAFLSSDGLAWTQSGAVLPNWITPVSTAQVAQKYVVVCGSAAQPFTLPSGYVVPANTLAFWVVDGRSGQCIAAYGVPAYNGQEPAGAVPALVYIGSNTLWCAVQTATDVYAALLDLSTTTYTPLGQIFSNTYANLPGTISYVAGGVRPGQSLGDVYMLETPNTDPTTTAPSLSVFLAGSGTATPLTVPAAALGNSVTIGAGPPGQLSFEFVSDTTSGSVTNYTASTFVNTDVLNTAWPTTPYQNADILGILGYWRGGWVRVGRGVASSAVASSAPFVSILNGPAWNSFLLPPTTVAPQSFYSTERFLVSPEGPWVFGNNAGSLLSAPFPFTSYAGYAVFPLGPNQMVWSNLY